MSVTLKFSGLANKGARHVATVQPPTDMQPLQKHGTIFGNFGLTR